MEQIQTTALVSRDPAAIAAAESAKARIQAAYIMAMNKPRNEDEARIKILNACKRPAFAERVEFSKPVGKMKIKGPSIRLAELVLREWENIYSDTQVIYEDDTVRRVRVSIIDLETNAQFSKEVQIRKTVERKKPDGYEIVGERTNSRGEKVYIVNATDDDLQNKENALISKAIRNEGLRLIPSDIIDEAIDTARETLRKKNSEDPQAAKKKIFDSFYSVGISPKELEKYLKHSVETISPAELEELRGIFTSIKEGSSTWADYNKPEDNKEPREPVPPGTDPYKTKETKPSIEPEDGHQNDKAKDKPEEKIDVDEAHATIDFLNDADETAILNWINENRQDFEGMAIGIKKTFKARYKKVIGTEFIEDGPKPEKDEKESSDNIYVKQVEQYIELLKKKDFDDVLKEFHVKKYQDIPNQEREVFVKKLKEKLEKQDS
jgi:hypothetical protein